MLRNLEHRKDFKGILRISKGILKNSSMIPRGCWVRWQVASIGYRADEDALDLELDTSLGQSGSLS